MIEPRALTAASFTGYTPQAQAFAVENLPVLRILPLPLLVIMLGRIVRYDVQFPAEQQNLQRQFAALHAMRATDFNSLMAPFAALRLDDSLAKTDWLKEPRRYSERMSAWLWTSHQLDAYRSAGQRYEERLADALTGKPPAVPRYTIVLIGNGAQRAKRPLFRQLRSRGTYFSAVQREGAIDSLYALLKARTQQHPGSYLHWHIDGGEARQGYGDAEGITLMSYTELGSVAFKELGLISSFAGNTGGHEAAGPEAVQSYMASLGAKDLGLTRRDGDRVFQEFQASIFTSGAGTQIFSTTFVQWTAREVLHRAEPLTLFARFRPRQTFTSIEALLQRNPLGQKTDPDGSLVDADMGAFYTWINQSRLPGSEQSRFLVWFEDQAEAVAIAPSLARGTTSSAPVTMQQVLQWMA